MDAYAPLLVRTRVPQPSLQRFAVIQIFEKLRSSPWNLNSSSDPGREAITQCLLSPSLAVVDQSVRELCRLVKDSKLDLSFALLDLHSALEGCPPRFVTVFVKGIGFLVRFGFRANSFLSNTFLDAPENHPFVKVLTCRPEVHNELVQQVVLFVVNGKQCGIGEVCNYLRPLLTFSVVRACSSDSSFSSFLSRLLYLFTTVCCTLLHEANPLFEMLIGCLRCFNFRGAEDLGKIVIFAEFLVDGYTAALRDSVKMGLMVTEVQLIGEKLLHALLTLCLEFEKHSITSKPVLELSRRCLSFQKELELPHVRQLFSPMSSLFLLLAHLELEDEKLNVLDFLASIFRWRNQDENVVDGVACKLSEVSLFLFPMISWMSSPSKTVKKSVSQFLLMLENLLVSHPTIPRDELSLTTLRDGLSVQRVSLFVSTPETIIFRLMQHLWLQDLSQCSYFLNIYSAGGSGNISESGSKIWISQLGKYALSITGMRKSCDSIPAYQEAMSTEIPFILGSIAGSLVLHEYLGSYAVETLAGLSKMEPKLGVTLFLAVLYYCNLLRCDIRSCNDLLLKLMWMLSSLASNSSMLPLIFQTILPMLHRDSNPVLYATALRLLCKAWEMNDRVFGSLRNFLLPECFVAFRYNRTIATSLASSLRDVCKRNPERGVQLILSVAACIECTDPVVRALGFESLGYLCEADVVDFYTAWNVIAKHGEYSTNPIIAYSLCFFLRWGAMDSEAYAEASVTILQILWDIGSFNCSNANALWKRARVTALEALNCFEVLQIQKSIPDFRDKVVNALIHEIDIYVLRVIEELEHKVIAYEHSIRRRSVKEHRTPRSRFEKLLDVFPHVICSSAKSYDVRMMPGTALYYLQFNQKYSNSGKSKTADDVFSEYHNILMDAAASLNLSRNIVIALLSLQSWKTLMQNWLKDYASVLGVKASSTSKAANNILKSMIKVAEDSMTLPRVVENIALAMGAFCAILPASVHPVKATASKFLLNWLFQYEHEHRQWSAAISIGLISIFLHSTDRQLKLQCVNGLLQVAWESKNVLVKGACGIGLGYSCQDLLTRAVAADNALDRDSFIMQEKNLLGKIVRTLSLTIWQLTKFSSDLLVSLSDYKAPGLEDDYARMTSALILKSDDDVEDDVWGVTGLVMGLGMSVSALSRAGSYDAICKIKFLLTSWIAPAESPILKSSSGCQISNMMLSTAACLVLPTVVSICRKVELMHDNELNNLLFSYEDLISKLQLEKSSIFFHYHVLVASCAGAGSLLAFILDEGLVSLDVQRVKNQLGLFRKIYSGTYPPLVHLGAFLGVVNAMGSATGITSHHCSPKVPVTFFERKESSHINAALLSSSCFAEDLLALLQDIFLVAQDSSDGQLQAYASWALSFLHCHLSSKEDNDEIASSMPIGQIFSMDATILKLSTWLTQIDYSRNPSHVNTVASVLRCLSGAPRLPKLDWGAVVRRCMKYEAHIAEVFPQGSSYEKRSLLKECLHFSLAHATKFDSLLSMLDDLTSLFRFRTLDLITQSCLLFHLSDLIRIFSNSRISMLLEDISEFLSSTNSSYQNYNARQKRFFRLSCWKGLSKCFSEASIDTSEFLSRMEKCLEILFALLPAQSTITFSKQGGMPYLEWNEAIVCLGKGRNAWLLDLLQISVADQVPRDEHFGAMLKKMLAISQLVKFGSLPLTELAKLKRFMLNTQSQGMWELFVEVMAVLEAAEGSTRRQWLIDVLEISCITRFPSTALLFLGLLSGCFCKYMPFLLLDPQAVLADLPVTLSSLLSSTKWRVVTDTAVSYLWTLTLRIHSWAKTRDCDGEPTSNDIDSSEAELSNLLMQVLLDACHNLREFLPLKDQLKLANMVKL